jgi:hypothetical protein
MENRSSIAAGAKEINQARAAPVEREREKYTESASGREIKLGGASKVNNRVCGGNLGAERANCETIEAQLTKTLQPQIHLSECVC